MQRVHMDNATCCSLFIRLANVRIQLTMFFRPAILLNAASQAAATGATRRAVLNTSSARAVPVIFSRLYTSGLSSETIETRVLDIVKGFDKVDASKVMDMMV